MKRKLDIRQRLKMPIILAVSLLIASCGKTTEAVSVETGEELPTVSSLEEIPLFINGTQVELGEITLEELIDSCNLSCDYIASDNNKAGTVEVELITEDSDKRVYAEIYNGKGAEETDLKDRLVYGVSIYNTGQEISDLVVIGDLCTGDSSSDVETRFGNADLHDTFSDGYGTLQKYCIDKTYDITIDTMRGTVTYMEMSRRIPDELEAFEGFKQEWLDTDRTKKIKLGGFSMRIPAESIITKTHDQIVVDYNTLHCSISRDKLDNELVHEDIQRDSYAVCFRELIDTAFRSDVDFEKSQIDDYPAVYYHHRYIDEEDGKEHDYSGVIIATKRFVYRFSYSTLTSNEEDIESGNKMISSIRVRK